MVSTVRSEGSAKRCAHLQELARLLPGTLELQVADLLTSSFDEAVKGGARHRQPVRRPCACQYPGRHHSKALHLPCSGPDSTLRAGCRFVFHLASPVLAPNPDSPMESQVQPALSGTRNVLEAVGRAQGVQRVVLTSSTSGAPARAWRCACMQRRCIPLARRPASHTPWCAGQ